MPDITMCSGKDCEKKETCYRYTALPNPWYQSYFALVPLVTEDDGSQYCDEFIRNEVFNGSQHR
jgi:hypothetical protein